MNIQCRNHLHENTATSAATPDYIPLSSNQHTNIRENPIFVIARRASAKANHVLSLRGAAGAVAIHIPLINHLKPDRRP